MTADPVLEHQLFTVDEYERMVEVGILDADSRVELLNGEIGDRVFVHTRPADGEYGLVRAAHRGEELSPGLVPSLAITVDEILGE